MSNQQLELLKKNLRYIANNEDEIRNIEQKLSENIDINLSEDAPGRYNLVIRNEGEWKSFHRKIDPFNEFDISPRAEEKIDVYVCIGTGFGYQFTSVMQQLYTARTVIIAEPSFEALFLFLTSFDLEKMFDERFKLLYCPEPEILQRFLEEQIYRYHETSVQIHSLGCYQWLKPGFVSYVAEEMRTVWDRHLIYLASQQEQNKEILFNTLQNSLRLPECFRVMPHCALGKPVVVTGSGPSLAHHIQLLRGVQDRFHIIAVGSALPVLLDNNVRPDFVVISDPQHLNRLHFSEAEYDIDLLTDITVDPDIVGRFKARTSLINIGHNLPLILFDQGELLKLDNWGTVTSTALSLADVMGFTEIALLGAEFSYQTDANHAAGYKIRSSTSQESEVKTLDSTGKRVITTEIFQSYANFTDGLSKRLAKRQRNVINCSDGGLLKEPAIISFRHFVQNNDPQKNKEPLDWCEQYQVEGDIAQAFKLKLENYIHDVKVQIDRTSGGEVAVRELSRLHLLSALEGLFWRELKDMEEAEILGENETLVKRAGQLKKRFLELANEAIERLINAAG